MSDTKYNGWSNYATWRINLEIFDGFDVQELDGVDESEVNINYISNQLEDYAQEIIFSGLGYDERRPSNLMEDYARAFLQDVNWYEIAEHMIDDYIRENQEEE
jgi:hypothetical protein